MDERRRYDRATARINARFVDIYGAILKGVIRDISMGGAYINTPTPLEKGEIIKVTMDFAATGKIIGTLGRVIRIFPMKGMAIEFDDRRNPEIRRAIETLGRAAGNEQA